MSETEPEPSANRAALGASLPGAAAHVVTRSLLRRLLLPLVLAVPVGGAVVGVAWRLSHLRASAEDVAATQAAVVRATDEVEATVDEALRGETTSGVSGADALRARPPRGPTQEQLDTLAAKLDALKHLPPPEEVFAEASAARARGDWARAADLFRRVGEATKGTDQRLALQAKLAASRLLLERLDDPSAAYQAYGDVLRLHFERSAAAEMTPKQLEEARTGRDRARHLLRHPK